MSIVVFNAGSSSLKLGLYDGDATLATGLVDWEGRPGEAELTLRQGDAVTRSRHRLAGYGAAVQCAVEAVSPLAPAIAAVGQRVVHGGTRYSGSVRIDSAVEAELSRLTELAPLHNPPALAAIAAVRAALPGIPQVAVFDTAYFATLPPTQKVYPLPYEWYSDWGIRRFGFHGISHSYCAARVAELLGGREGLRVVSCHLGNGCSATASRGGVAVATTMGFTPLDGLMMGTRPGALDPGILLYVMRQHGCEAAGLEELLNHGAGLKGVSGVSSDYRQVEDAARAGDARARLALDLYAVHVRAAIGELAVTLGGVDALVFTAGVGEHSAALRAAACDGLECLGLRLDAAKNEAARADCEVARAGSVGSIWVLETREEWMIARETRRLLA